MKSVVIRSAVESDAEGIANVQVQSWRETYTGLVPTDYLADLSIKDRTTMWKTIFATPTIDSTFVASLNGKIVGFVSGGSAREDYGFDSELYAIYLLKRCQKWGIGKKLFEQLKDNLKKLGSSSMYLWVLRDSNTTNFYRAMGGIKSIKKEECIGGKLVIEEMYVWPSL